MSRPASHNWPDEIERKEKGLRFEMKIYGCVVEWAKEAHLK